MTEILKVTNVSKHYGAVGSTTKALDNVSFSVSKGEFTAIMGASGSGKSTLLNVISTIDRVSGGDIVIDGESIVGKNEDFLSRFRRDKLGFIFQDYNLLDTLSVEENIILPLNLKKMNSQTTAGELKRVSETLGITDQLKKFPLELSGGQRQRVACARAIITSPAIVMADEPTGALDSANSKLLMQTFTRMNAALSSTILMVTHDALVGSYANRVLFLKDGAIYAEVQKGTKSRKEMYESIISTVTELGGEGDVR